MHRKSSGEAEMPQNDPLFELAQAERNEVRRSRMFLAGGLTALAMGGVIAGVEVTQASDRVEVDYQVDYIPEAQDAIESVDNTLSNAGRVALPLGLLIVGGSMIAGGSRNRWSSTQLDSDKPSTRSKRVLQVASAGTVPLLAAAGAGMTTFSSTIGEAITTGPSEPIESIAKFAPGESWIVQDDNAKPMVQSNLSAELVGKVSEIATEENISVVPFNLYLGDIDYGDQKYANLSVGLYPESGSAIDWIASDGCEEVPIAIDEASNIPVGSRVEVSGVNAVIVDEVEGTSAINRIGAIMDVEAMGACLYKGADTMHAVAIDASPEKAAEILREANTSGETATVISKQQYVENSEEFWRANVKPITNVLSLVSLAFAGAAMAGAAGARLYRSKRHWAQKLADGVSYSTIRATESLRSVKEGVAAGVIGSSVAGAATPFVGIFEAGLHASVTASSWFAGAAVGILGPVLGTSMKMVRMNKTVNKTDDTRGA